MSDNGKPRERIRLCECGCGRPAGAYASDGIGRRKGQPKRFLHGHQPRGAAHWCWKGGSIMHASGYRMVRNPDHPRAHNGYVLEHIEIAERALGKALPDGAEVHHVNRDCADNRGRNLVICENRAYHRILHSRTAAHEATGDADSKKCVVCGEFGDPERDGIYVPKRTAPFHRECRNRQLRAARKAKKEAA